MSLTEAIFICSRSTFYFSRVTTTLHLLTAIDSFSSKRIFFPAKNRTLSTGSADATEPEEESYLTPSGSTYAKPYDKHTYIPRALQADRNLPNNGPTSSQTLVSRISPSQERSSSSMQGELRSPGGESSQKGRVSGTHKHTGPRVTEDTLRRLAGSSSLLALLTAATTGPEVGLVRRCRHPNWELTWISRSTSA